MIITGTRVRGGRYYGGTGSASDAYFDLVALLLPGNGTNGAQNNTFQDSSTNAFTITRNGNTTQGTFSPFSQTGWSNYLNGSSYFTAPGSTAFAFGTGAFTIEMWLYVTAYPANYAVIPSNRPYNAGSTDTWGVFFFNDGAVRFSDVNNTQTFQTSAGAVPLNAWTHLAVVRNSTASNDTKIYINGTSVAQGTINSNFANNTNAVVFGTSYDSNNWYVTSYASNLRIVKGTAVYTSNFTPSTTALTNISGTSLLTCQSNRFVDNSSNIFAISLSGTPSVQAFSPFNPTTAYAAGTVGGSGYFDGTGDYLSAPSSNNFGFGTGDFTIECWVYPLASTAQRLLFGGGDMNNLDIGFSPANTFQYYDGSVRDTGVSAAARQWFHFAVSRTSGTTSVYVNGVRTNNFSDTSNTSARQYYVAGSNTGTNPFNGYISNARIIKGTGIYSGTTITVPTAPFTAIANTQLLLNFTNGGITDAAAKNVLETVDGAAISTAQSKWGGSAMYFDGSGDWLINPPSAQNQLGTGDFTVEFWFYSTSSADVGIFNISATSSSGSAGMAITKNTSNQITFWVNGNGGNTVTTSTYSINAWHHVALVRNGSTNTLYVDGVSAASNSNTPTWASTPCIGVGRPYNDNTIGAYIGYINDLRITRGYARYTANFTPPTAAFPTQ
jgi:hypothetical protein